MKNIRGLLSLILTLAICLILILGCSQAQDATAPSTQSQDAQTTNNDVPGTTNEGINNRSLWGLWLIGVDPENHSTEIVPVRSPQAHWNVLNWLEKWPCANCLQVMSFTNSDHGTKLVDIKIKHPFSNANLTGFDVRGIAMFNGSHTFPISGLNVPDRTGGDGELLNADGFTTLYNFSTVGEGPGGLQGYLKGKFATATIPNAKLNGFMRFVSPNPENTRQAFYAGDTITRTYDIDMPDSPFVMGYAVDASWAPPTNKPVDDPMADFPPEANCYEPYGINLSKTGGVLLEAGGFIGYKTDIFDHQDNITGNEFFAECPELFSDSPALYNDGTGNLFFVMGNQKQAPVGLYKLLVSIEDPENVNSPSWIDLTAYQIYNVEVEEDAGWARTWGGFNYDQAEAVCVDPSYNTYVAGEFSGVVDFDPGPEATVLTSYENSLDAFVVKFDPLGNFAWARSWGSFGSDYALGIGVRNYRVMVVGSFEYAVDFDPGSGQELITSQGGTDAYLSVLHGDGNLDYVQTWGSALDDVASAVGTVDSHFAIAGSFEGTAELPGGTGYSQGGSDIFVAVANTNYFLKTLGGSADDKALGVAVSDNSVCITGTFENGFYFGSGDDYHMSNGSTDAFVVRYKVHPVNYSLTYDWSRAWGGTLFDYGYDVACNASNGDVYVAGSFIGTVNFNTGPVGPVDNHTSNGFGDAFVSHYNSSSDYLGTTTWGGSDGIYTNGASGISVDESGNVYCAGGFVGSTLGQTSKGLFDCIMVKYSPDLDFDYARSWGASGSDSCTHVMVDNLGRPFLSGNFKKTVDFNPGSGVENHTSWGGTADCFLMKFLPSGSW